MLKSSRRRSANNASYFKGLSRESTTNRFLFRRHCDRDYTWRKYGNDKSRSKFVSNETSDVMANVNTPLRCKVQEDRLRVVYPLCDEFPSFHKVNGNELTNAVEITDGVFWVHHRDIRYVLKIVDRLLYQPRAPIIFERSLRI
jgi:hypothetical protein